MNQWLRRGALGCAVGMAALVVPGTAFAYGPGGANNGYGLTLSVSVGVGGDSVTVSASTGPCLSGTGATISLVRAIANQIPVTLGATTVNPAGGLYPSTVVIPPGTPVGVYIMFATCSGGGGTTDVFTASFVVDGPIVAGTLSQFVPAASTVTLSPRWSTAATRSAVQSAIDATLAQSSSTPSGSGTSSGNGARNAATLAGGVSGSSGGSSGSSGSSGGSGTHANGASGSGLVAAPPLSPAASLAHSQSVRLNELVTWVIVAAAVLGLAAVGLLALRRRRLVGN